MLRLLMLQIKIRCVAYTSLPANVVRAVKAVLSMSDAACARIPWMWISLRKLPKPLLALQAPNLLFGPLRRRGPLLGGLSPQEFSKARGL